MEYLQDIVGRNVKARRKAAGMNIQALANAIGAPDSTGNVTKWEKGLIVPNAYNLCALADVFGCTVDELLGR